jgi:hypothetical protein
MLVFRCTKNARQVLGLRDQDLYDGEDADLAQWFVDVATFDYQRCLLLTHKPTRYSLWIPGVKRADRDRFGDLFGQHLLRTLRADGFDHMAFERLFRQGHRFAKTNDRSVLGSMNDHIYNSRWYFHQGGGRHADVAAINAQLNRTPMGGLAPGGELEFPVEVMARVVYPAAHA